jgi:succinate dehydrogenase / fumarate reductase membrane anchor subunit
MKKTARTLRTPLARARNHGSARHGSGHWWAQRLTSMALVPLSIYVIVAFFLHVVPNGYQGAVTWLSSPFASVFVILFLGVGLHHASSGLQVVIEDYVHGEGLKIASIIFIKFLSVVLALLAAIAVVKVLFFAVGFVSHA